MSARRDLCNVAIAAHINYGKMILVDVMLWQSGAFSERGTVEKTDECVTDSGDLEREKGTTILTKNTTAHYSGPAVRALGLGDRVTINVVDTPGHTDFGGEVERGLSMVDGIILMVDASEGPLPQTRLVFRKALQVQLPAVVVVDKVDHPDSRIEEVVSETTDLLLSLGEDFMNDGVETDVDFPSDVPVIHAFAKAGACPLESPGSSILPTESLESLFETILSRTPDPSYEGDAPLQAYVMNLDVSSFLGRLALLCIHNGTLTKGASLGLARRDGTIADVRVIELLRIEGFERIPTESVDPGEIVVVAGIEDITIGESLVDPEGPRPLPLITTDDPVISMIIGINTSPLAGRVRGAKATARQVKDRLDRELVGNVSLRVPPTERPDVWEVQGQGELVLAILVEQMRREGFGPTAGKSQVVIKEIEGVRCESTERMTTDILEEHLGAVIQLMAAYEGRMETMSNHGSGWIRPEFVVSARGPIGSCTCFLMETRGTDIAPSIAEGYVPWRGTIKQRLTGSLVADRAGQATPYVMTNLQERGPSIVGPSSEVYEGQVVGENPRGEDMDVNIRREKKQANIRSATANVYESLTSSRKLTLEESLEFAANDECVEVTLDATRVRKAVLDAQERFKIAARERRAQK